MIPDTTTPGAVLPGALKVSVTDNGVTKAL
jgi:hypothetical protein